MIRIALVYGLVFLLSFSVSAQKPSDKTDDVKVVQDFLEKLIENSESTIDYTDLQDQLLYFYRNPIDLNHATKEDLEKLGFLTEMQINGILSHRLQFGNFISTYELQVIDGFTPLQLQSLLLFATVNANWKDDQTPLKDMFLKARDEVYFTGQRTLQEQKGYKSSLRNTTPNYYTGSPNRYMVRYGHRYGTRLSIGLTAEKDAGEQFFKGANKNGFDFYSAHLFWKGRGNWRTVAIGDYQAAFGQGLTFASGLAFGKSPFVLNVKRNFQTLRPYRSVNENEFLRGAAATYRLGKIEITTLYSDKKIDGNIAANSDSLVTSDESSFTSIISSGYHRTTGELADKRSIRQIIYGGHMSYQFKNLQLGTTVIQTVYDKTFQKSGGLYNLYAFSGKTLLNTGIDYTWYYRNITFFGEIANSGNGAIAQTHGLIASLNAITDISLLYRNFDKNYHTTYSNGFGESSTNTNERGIYTGISLRPVPKWTINAYADVYKSNWIKYLTDAPSYGYDYLAEVVYNPSKSVQMYWRYRNDNKEKNAYSNSTVSDYLTWHRKYAFRYHIAYKVSSSFTLKNRIEYTEYQTENTKTEHGTVFFQDVVYKPMKGKWDIIARLAIFNTQGYNSRIYTYENDLLYQFSVPVLQNEGARYFLLLNYKFSRKAEFWIKFAHTVYSNQTTVSSGLDEIQGNKKSDLKIQLRITL